MSVFVILTWNCITAREGVPCVALGAATDGIVVDDLTTSILSTCSWTWIPTFLTQTCLSQRTFRTDYTFWTA